MRQLFLVAFLAITSLSAYAQIEGDMMVSGHADLIKTDNESVLGKLQFGGEFNYFFTRQFTGTGGFDVWTDDGVSFILGMRWYPADAFFVRARGIIGENDLSIGGGWNMPFNGNWRFEAIGDFYFKGEFAIRAGVSYILRKD